MTMEEVTKELEKHGISEDETVYRLCIADVTVAMEDEGLLALVTIDQLLEIIACLKNKLEIPWTEYVVDSVECSPTMQSIYNDHRKAE